MHSKTNGIVSNNEAKKLVNDASSSLFAANTPEAIFEIPERLGLNKKFHYNTKKYPNIDFTISGKDIKKLKQDNILTNDLNIRRIPVDDVLAKLLYAVLWKQGDLQKVRHIIEGICGESVDGNTITFYQFGRHLANAPEEPIIDQHAIRAFEVYQNIEKKDDVVDALRRKSTLKIKDKEAVNEYKKWLDEKCSGSKELRKSIDSVLYAVGKSIKLNGAKNENNKVD